MGVCCTVYTYYCNIINETANYKRKQLYSWFDIPTLRNTLMDEPPIAIEFDCATQIETIRPLTVEEQVQREQDMSRAEAERLAKEQVEQVEAAERLALATWIAGQSTLPEAARNALARATGVTLPGGTG